MVIQSFKTGENGPTRNSFDQYDIPLVKIKDFNALIDNRSFFDQPIKNKQEPFEKLFKMARNNDYTTGNLLDYSYHRNYCKLIDTDLSRQANTTIPQKIDFIRELEEDDGAICFLFLKSSKKLF